MWCSADNHDDGKRKISPLVRVGGRVRVLDARSRLLDRRAHGSVRGHAASTRGARTDQGLAVHAHPQPEDREGWRHDHPDARLQRLFQIQRFPGAGQKRRKLPRRHFYVAAGVQIRQRVQGQMEGDHMPQRTGQRKFIRARNER